MAKQLRNRIIYLKQECIPVGCVLSPALAVCPGGGGGAGVSVWRGCMPRGVYALPSWTEFLTRACENITFPQLCLRTVISVFQHSKIYVRSGER